MVQERQETRKDRRGLYSTGHEVGMDNTIPGAWRSSQLRTSHGPWLVGAVDKTDRTGLENWLDRTGQDWKMGWTGQEGLEKGAGQYNT